MAVFVTGASGFLGGRLVQMLHRQGAQVRILARPRSDLRHLAGIPVEIVHGDLSATALLAGALDGVTHIYHCAACSTDWAPLATYHSANVAGTQYLLRAARDAPKLERFLHISTTDIYGYPLIPCSEDQPFHDAGLPYNSTKGQGEQAVWNLASDLPITILRPATIYGPRGKDFTQEIATMLRQRMMAIIDHGVAPGGFTYVDNVVDAILSASTSPHTIGKAYNVSDGTNASWLDYLTLFSRRLRTPLPWINLSFSAAMNAASLFELPHRMLGLGGRPLLTRHAVYLLGRNQEFPIARATRDFDFKPAVSLEEGVDRSATWLETERKSSR